MMTYVMLGGGGGGGCDTLDVVLALSSRLRMLGRLSGNDEKADDLHYGSSIPLRLDLSKQQARSSLPLTRQSSRYRT
jgi:hypothetical protein